MGPDYGDIKHQDKYLTFILWALLTLEDFAVSFNKNLALPIVQSSSCLVPERDQGLGERGNPSERFPTP